MLWWVSRMDWQVMATAVVVLSAAGITTRRVVRLVTARTSGGCGRCGSGCKPAATVNSLPLVSLGNGLATPSERPRS
jgi:hypothetical protein